MSLLMLSCWLEILEIAMNRNCLPMASGTNVVLSAQTFVAACGWPTGRVIK